MNFCVSGVTVRKGQEEIEVHAPVVISNAGIFNTFQKFLPQYIQEKPGNTCRLIISLQILNSTLYSFLICYVFPLHLSCNV